MAEPAEIAARIEQLLAPGSLARPARPRHRRRHPRAARRRALPRQPLLGPDGRRPRRGGAAARRRGGAARRQPRRAGARRGRDDRDADRGGDARRRRSRSQTATSRCSRRPSATTGRSPPLAAKRPKGEQAWTVELEPTADIAALLGERKRPGQLLVAFGAELGAAGLDRKRRHARGRRTPTSSSSTTSPAPTSPSTRPTTRSCSLSGLRERPVAKAAKARDRRRDPRRGRAPARARDEPARA